MGSRHKRKGGGQKLAGFYKLKKKVALKESLTGVDFNSPIKKKQLTLCPLNSRNRL
jgi:hypothetical protein